VVEPKSVVAGEGGAVRAHELLAREREQDPAETGRRALREQLVDCAPVKETSLHRGMLKHRPLGGLQAVDPGREERVDRRRHRIVSGVRVSREHGEHLLDEERIALCHRQDPPAERRRELLFVEKPLDQTLGLRAIERVERDDRGSRLRRRPGRSCVEHVGTSQTEDQDRRTAREPRQVLQQVEQSRLGPMDVVEDDDERPTGGESLEDAAECPCSLFRRHRLVSGADGSCDESRCGLAALGACQQLCEPRLRIVARDLPHDLRQR